MKNLLLLMACEITAAFQHQPEIQFHEVTHTLSSSPKDGNASSLIWGLCLDWQFGTAIQNESQSHRLHAEQAVI